MSTAAGVPRLVLNVGDQGVDELGVNQQPCAPSRQLDCPAQLLTAHRPDEDVVGAEQPRQRRIARAATIEVGPDHEHDDALVLASRDGVDERMALVLVATGGEDLLELVDDEHRVLPRAELGLRVAQRAQRMLARANRTCGHSLLPGSTPAANEGSSPARTSDDLPLPDGPTAPTSGAPTSFATSSATRRSRPKKYPASATSNAASPLNGHIAGAASSRGDRCARARPATRRGPRPARPRPSVARAARPRRARPPRPCAPRPRARQLVYAPRHAAARLEQLVAGHVPGGVEERDPPDGVGVERREFERGAATQARHRFRPLHRSQRQRGRCGEFALRLAECGHRGLAGVGVIEHEEGRPRRLRARSSSCAMA